MRKVKKINVHAEAFELGRDSCLEQALIDSGKIIKHDSHYEIYSAEASCSGEIAKDGDFIKIDKAGNPYPNSRDRFLDHHEYLENYNYIQSPRILLSWKYGDCDNEIIDYLLDSGKLIINSDSEESFYQADIWGTTLKAKKDDIILIYDIKKVGNKIICVDFNLIDREEFEKTYEYID